MATALKNLSEYNSDNLIPIDGKRFGLVVAEWNKAITDTLCKGAYETLVKHGAKPENIERITVPGSFELTLGAQFLAQSSDIDAVICLGVVIKGETKHDDYICHAVAQGITQVGLKFNKPIIFGLVTTNDEQQAWDRAGGKHGNKGVEAAAAAIQMLGVQLID
ncbi:6,7-dimethyl-8-ribityllumazine synthase [Adhaeribacter rhizoryzae]|uniref:6,7-dimethyl-8-ribityllumazine synthase n=1 Tax=Adhaeribacter rhizoryzae TaxID=2607907 RepID=A0A5M6DJ54_9BACT|nr:6,7-dimethyl-8-ribityllumazine synthase [Adhaeribacter rhizoryzae]KAA5546406.1 6,7-dimethyl-8-ribityllumazine synthase [Adhaeribacter rhizoryzae]